MTLQLQTGAGTPVAATSPQISGIRVDLGLGNVDNTSDANKPISVATTTALAAKQATLVAGTNITITGATIAAAGGGGGSVLPSGTAFAQSVLLTGNLDMGELAVTGPLTFTANAAGAVNGAQNHVTLIPDGVNAPNITAFNLFNGSQAYSQANVNELFFQRLGTRNYGGILVGPAYTPPVTGPVAITLASTPNNGRDPLFVSQGTETYGYSADPGAGNALGQKIVGVMAGDGWIESAYHATTQKVSLYLSTVNSTGATGMPQASGTYGGAVQANNGNVFDTSAGAYTNTYYAVAAGASARARLRRVGTTVTFETTENDGVTWTVATTYAAASSGTLYCYIAGEWLAGVSITIINPRSVGVA